MRLALYYVVYVVMCLYLACHCAQSSLATTGINQLMLTFLATKWLKDKTMRSTPVCVQRQNAYLHSLVSLSTLYH